jgi:GDP-mannose 4,6-dehydratase
MSQIVSMLESCRICKGKQLKDVIDLGSQYITSRFPQYGDMSTPKTEITLCLCLDCELLQLKQSTNSSELYEHEYGYMSGISNTMRAHLKQYKEEIVSHIHDFKPGDIVIDIGSNDSTMLQMYPSDVRRIGVDPTGKQFAQYYGDVELLPTYFTKENVVEKFGNIRCKSISSISMFYDLPDPVQFAKDIYSLLDDDGIWTCEQSYMPTMLERNSIDTICHEHLEYYALKQVHRIAVEAGFKIFNVSFNECNGGSFRVYFAKMASSKYTECTQLISQILEKERALELGNPETYNTFMNTCRTEVDDLKSIIKTIKQNGEKVYIYGASTKGNCLLQFAEIGESLIPYAVERNLNKVGKMTNTGIPIISEETMRKNPPKYLLVLPWHFRDEIIKREDEYLEAGGQFIFPFPKLEIYSKKKKALVTGNTGLIGTELIKQLNGEYTLYGINRNSVNQHNVIEFQADINDGFALNNIFRIVKPDVVVHLAGISSSQTAKSNSLFTLITNGLSTACICEIIERYQLKTKLINASSSEIYKGHGTYVVKENDTHMNHLHPYSIAKTLGHNVVKMYRENGYNFSNAVIFTTESKDKSPQFLLNKVATHAARWEKNKETLYLGNLDSSRDILHVSDVANALVHMIKDTASDDYLVCSNVNTQIRTLVENVYNNFGIQFEKQENKYYEKNTGNLIIETDPNLGCENVCHISGECRKLIALGWSPKMNIDQIIYEICESKI